MAAASGRSPSGTTIRAYHVLDHVAHCLDELDAARDLAHDPLAVELALSFHDAVYDTHPTDNAARSAVLAATTARSMGLSEATMVEDVRDVENLIDLLLGRSELAHDCRE